MNYDLYLGFFFLILKIATKTSSLKLWFKPTKVVKTSTKKYN